MNTMNTDQKTKEYSRYIEITEEAGKALLGKKFPNASTLGDGEFYEWVSYIVKGVKMKIVYNYLSNVTQYYLEDINA